MKKEMLINVLQPEECRIAIIENGVLEELYVERTSHESYVGNIYKGRIVNIEPSIQAAFVDFGVGRNGFLHVSDVEPAYYRHLESRQGNGSRNDRRRPRPTRVSRPGVEIPPASKEPKEEEQAAGLPQAIFKPEEFLPALPLPPGFGSAENIALVSESATCEESEWLGEVDGNATTDVQDSGEHAEAGEIDEVERTHPALFDELADEDTEVDEDELEHPSSLDASEEDAEHEDVATSEYVPSVESHDWKENGEGDEDEASADLDEDGTDEDDSYYTASTSCEEPGESSENGGEFADEDLSFSMRRSEDANAIEAADEVAEGEPLASEAVVEKYPQDAIEQPIPMEEELAEVSVGVGARPRSERQEVRRNGGRDRQKHRGGSGGRGGPRRAAVGRPKPLIQDIFKKGQEVLVQVIKEGIGTKGPTLSTYISIAGRYLVLMPGLNRIGVSRKITDEEQRRRLREILSELKPPRGLGFIIRTAGLDRTKKELQRDLAYLARLWQVVVRRIRKLKAPAEIYQESDMITRTIRDTFTSEIQTIWVDEQKAFEHAQEFLQIVMPRYANRIKHYNNAVPMFHKYRIEEEIGKIHQRHVPLPNGGSIVIDQTEALVAIDVNSGNFRADNNAEETAYQMNLYAAKEIARQLRLRDLGGVIINDFIDMREEKHRRGVERAMRAAVKRDRARTKILKISAFGIIEMTRQRIRPSLKRSVYEDCPHCSGSGQVKTCESMSIDVMRMLQLAASRDNIRQIVIRVHDNVSNYLHNRKRKELAHLEQETGTTIDLRGVTCVSPEYLEFLCYDSNNNEVRFAQFDDVKPRRRY